MVTLSNGTRMHTLPPQVRLERLQSMGSCADMSWKPDLPCLTVVSAAASSSSGRANAAVNTLDRDLRTRWSAEKSGAQWILYDLGKTCGVSSVSLVGFAPRAGEAMVKIEVSTDGKAYKTVDSGVLEGRGTNETLRSFLPQNAQFVRVYLNCASSGHQTSLQEVGIHGEAASASPGVSLGDGDR
jgi:hypothetical protein